MGSSFSLLSTKPHIVFTPNGSRQQHFSFPPDVIKFILKNISSPDIYRKLVRTCKYFYSKKRIAVYNNGIRSTVPIDKSNPPVLMDSRYYQIWLKNGLWCDSADPSGASKLLQRVFKCTLKTLHLSNQYLTFKDYYLLVSSKTVENCNLRFLTIYYPDESIAPFEDVLEQLPNIAYFRFIPSDNVESYYTSTTAQNLMDLPVFTKLKLLKLYRMNEKFDYISFCEFIKKNSKSSFGLIFANNTPLQYRYDFKRTVDKMLCDWNVPSNKPTVFLTPL